jgi:hypothetical protein
MRKTNDCFDYVSNNINLFLKLMVFLKKSIFDLSQSKTMKIEILTEKMRNTNDFSILSVSCEI